MRNQKLIVIWTSQICTNYYLQVDHEVEQYACKNCDPAILVTFETADTHQRFLPEGFVVAEVHQKTIVQSDPGTVEGNKHFLGV